MEGALITIANPWHHSVSSARRHGGEPDEYLEIHAWFDQSKEHLADFRHRALRHHTQGIFECERVFGPTITLATCGKCGKSPDDIIHDPTNDDGWHWFVEKLIPTRWIGEQHVEEDLGRIPTLADWLTCIEPEPWMNRSRRLSKELEQSDIDEIAEATAVHL